MLFIRENDFARFDLVDAVTNEVLATSSHPTTLVEFGTEVLGDVVISGAISTSHGEVPRLTASQAELLRGAFSSFHNRVPKEVSDAANA